MKPGLTLDELQRIRLWRVAHRADHPLEYHLWDVVLTLWVMGWMGIAPALVLGLTEWLPLCALALFSPSLYIGWRRRAQVQHRLRCDWLGPEA
jgi:uncharacterized membrane protein